MGSQGNDDGNTMRFPGAKIQKPGRLRAVNEIEVLNQLYLWLCSISFNQGKRKSSYKNKFSLLISFTSAGKRTSSYQNKFSID
jgi:hypothetical protein